MPEALPSKVIMRRGTPRDERRWCELVDGYCLFYKRTPSEPLTRHTWERIMDGGSPIHAIVAENPNEGVVGIANYVIHEHTLGPIPQHLHRRARKGALVAPKIKVTGFVRDA